MHLRRRGLPRDLRGPVVDAWAGGGRLAAALLGAFLFGLWHVLFGGFVKGNWRAGDFGVALAATAGAALALEVAVARRLLPPAGSS